MRETWPQISVSGSSRHGVSRVSTEPLLTDNLATWHRQRERWEHVEAGRAELQSLPSLHLGSFLILFVLLFSKSRWAVYANKEQTGSRRCAVQIADLGYNEPVVWCTRQFKYQKPSHVETWHTHTHTHTFTHTHTHSHTHTHTHTHTPLPLPVCLHSH